LWHVGKASPPGDIVGAPVRLALNRDRRLAVTRYHAVPINKRLYVRLEA
jgi:hypothetical protein